MGYIENNTIAGVPKPGLTLYIFTFQMHIHYFV